MNPTMIEMLSEPLTLFLEALLEDASSVRVVADSFRGLAQEDAKSYLRPPPSERMSDASLPGLSRWGNSCSQLIDSAEGIFPCNSPECPATPPSAAPKVPRRRTSIESSDDENGELEEEEEEEEEDGSLSSSTEDWDEEADSNDFSSALACSLMAWDSKFASLRENLTEWEQQDCLGGSLKDNRSPPKAPRRQNSLNYEPATLPMNVKLLREDQFEGADIQKVHKRRNGVSVPLSSMFPTRDNYSTSIENPSLALGKIGREFSLEEVLQQQLEEDGSNSSPMFSTESHRKQDSLPCCARRRPSPQLEKLASLRSMEGAHSKAPVGAKRRPSPQLQLGDADVGSDSRESSPVRAKRRPSPEYEAFGGLAQVLAGAVSIVEDDPSIQ